VAVVDRPDHDATSARPATAVSVAGLSKHFDSTPVLRGIDLEVPRGRILALLGPSGCGKTTLLRSIAGLERIDTGTIRLGDEIVADAHHHVAPERRRVGLVFQDWALFPHLTVAGNVGYGISRRRPRADRAERIERALAVVGLAGLGDRNPGTLSGGQQQRVALARAIAPEPALLLLDEPFSNLDAALRVEVRTEIHQLLVSLGITAVFVTHDQEEAFVIGDEVAVMSEGRIVQLATPDVLYTTPATEWVGCFVGDANVFDGQGEGASARTALDHIPLADRREGPVRVLVRPEDLHLEPGGSTTVGLVEYHGHDTLYHVRDASGTALKVRTAGRPAFRRGDRVTVTYDGGAAQSWPT